MTKGHKSISHEQFLRLFLGSERDIFRYAAAIVPNVQDAQDVVQETAVALWKKIDEYDSSQPFTPWACRFALLEARQFLKRNRRWRAFLDEALAEELAGRRSELSDQLNERRGHLAECLEALPNGQRRIVEGYYYRRTPVESLSNQTGRSVEAVYKALQRIRRALLECITRKMQPQKAEP